MARAAELGARRLSTPWTGRGTAAHRPPRSQPLGRHAALPSAVFFLERPPGRPQTSAATPPPPHFIWPPGSPGNVLPRCKENAAGTEENGGPGLSKQPAPFSRHLSPGAPAPRLLCPTGVSRSQTAPFSSQRTQGPAHSAACRESGPCLGIPPSGSRSPGVSEVNGRGWGREAGSLCFPSPSPPLAAATSGPRGLGGCWAAGAQAVPGGLGKSPGPGAGARGSRCRALSLGRRALQPWLKPTDENTERAAKS